MLGTAWWQVLHDIPHLPATPQPFNALTLMADNEIAYLPVMEGGSLVGALSYRRTMHSFLAAARQTGVRLEPSPRRGAGQ
jgi:predicted transcriptional regulator